MYSFYGGRPGNSFIIITTYRSIADMVAKFKLNLNRDQTILRCIMMNT